jgi:hypothetical protein
MIERLHQYLTARLLCHAHEYWAEAVLLVFTERKEEGTKGISSRTGV